MKTTHTAGRSTYTGKHCRLVVITEGARWHETYEVFFFGAEAQSHILLPPLSTGYYWPLYMLSCTASDSLVKFLTHHEKTSPNFLRPNLCSPAVLFFSCVGCLLHFFFANLFLCTFFLHHSLQCYSSVWVLVLHIIQPFFLPADIVRVSYRFYSYRATCETNTLPRANVDESRRYFMATIVAIVVVRCVLHLLQGNRPRCSSQGMLWLSTYSSRMYML